VPLADRRVVVTGAGAVSVQEGVRYEDVDSGFYVLPRLAGAGGSPDSGGGALAQRTLDRLQQLRDLVDAGHVIGRHRTARLIPAPADCDSRGGFP